MMSFPSPSTLSLEWPLPGIALLKLCRLKALNAMNKCFFEELLQCLRWIDSPINKQETRVIILASAHEKLFTAGLDLNQVQDGLVPTNNDTARAAWALSELIRDWQDAITALEKCRVPVIAVIHGACIGGGVDLVTAADIRICSQDAYFCIKEVDLAMAADIGTLQRLPKIVSNQSLVREWAFTGDKISAATAMEQGLASRILPSPKAALDEAMRIAMVISKKSPVAIAGIKKTLLHARDHSVADGLEYIRTLNASLLQTKDVMKAGTAILSKQKAEFAKL